MRGRGLIPVGSIVRYEGRPSDIASEFLQQGVDYTVFDCAPYSFDSYLRLREVPGFTFLRELFRVVETKDADKIETEA